MDNNPFENTASSENLINRPAIAKGLPVTPDVSFPNLQKGTQETLDPFDLYETLLGKGASKIDPILLSSFSREERYSRGTRPGDDWEEAYAQNQSRTSKAFNGVTKGLNLMGTTIAGGFATIYGAGSALVNGDITKIWNNTPMQEIQAWNEKVDREILPNFYTAKETDAEWWSTDNWLTTNFLFDKLIKNAGFAVGAMVGGNIANSLLMKAGTAIGKTAATLSSRAQMSQAFKVFTPVLRNTSRAFAQGKNIEAANVLSKELTSIADVTKRAEQLSTIINTASKYSKFGDTGRRGLVALYSQSGEASMEAIMGGNQFRESLIKEFIDKNGYEPTGAELDKLNETVRSFGKTSFFGNLALLTVTEYVQLPYLQGSSWKNSRNAIRNTTNDVIRVGSKLTKAAPKTTFGKLYKGTKRFGAYIFDPKEGGQEIGQFALEVGGAHYFGKANQTEAAEDWMDSVLYGFFGRDEEGEGKGALVSKEGIEGGILGGITGGLMQAGGRMRESKSKNINTQRLIEESEKAPLLKEVLADRLKTVNRGVILQEQQEEAAFQNDILESKDLKTDMIFNYAMHKIKFGRTDLVLGELQEMKKQVNEKEGFAKLQEEGIGNINDSKEDFVARIDEIESFVKRLDQTYEKLNNVYGAETITDKETGKILRKYSDPAIEYMAYSATKINDYESRILELNNNLISKGISSGISILENIVEENKPNKEVVEETIKQINKKDITLGDKNELKTSLNDMIELSLRRQSFLQEYNDVIENPNRYQVHTGYRKYGYSSELPVTVEQIGITKNKKGLVKVKKELGVGQEYSLKEPILRTGDTLQLSPKITILSQALGDEYKVLMPDGKIEYLTASEFKDYNISDENNTDEKLNDLMDKAIAETLKTPEFSGIEIPKETKNKLDFVNTLENKELTDAIEKNFSLKAKDLLETIEKEKALRNALLAQKAALDKQLKKLEESSGNNPPPPTIPGEFIGSEDRRKDVDILFLSGTSPSEDTGGAEKNNLPFIKRGRSFLNNFKFFKDKEQYKIILVTPNNAEALGLKGIVQLSYETPLDTKLTAEQTNTELGFMAQVFIKQTPKGDFFVDENGNNLSKVGKKNPTILDHVIFQTMTSASLKTIGGAEKVRKGQEVEAERALEAYKIFRANVFKQEGYTTYSFGISRGIPREIKVNDIRENNHIEFILGPNGKKIIATQNNLLTVVTTGKVEHNGELLTFPLGTTLIQYGDLLDFANNKKVNNKQASNIFAVINALSNDLVDKASKGKPITLDFNYSKFLQNVLYWRFKGDTTSPSQIGIDTATMSFKIGDKSFPLNQISENKQAIMNALQEAFITVNNKTLTTGVTKNFTEYISDKEGNLTTVVWPNYQSYLLSSTNPDGTSRGTDDTPLITHTAKPSEAGPSYKQKYAFISDKDVLPYEKVPVKPAAPIAPVVVGGDMIGDFKMNGEQVNTFDKLPIGPISFTGTILDNEIVTVDVISNQTIEDTSVDQVAVTGIINKLKSLPEDLVTIDLTKALNEDIVKFFAKIVIEGSLSKQLEKQKEVVEKEETPEIPEKPEGPKPYDPSQIKRRKPLTRLVGEREVERMTNADLVEFKQWHEKNVPWIPFLVLDKMIKLRGGVEAWGVFENGVAKFVRGGQRGTEYHEIFEAIWADFLTESEKVELIKEFRAKSGEFTDRSSGKKYQYSDPYISDDMIKERIADDFADFRVGKLTARSLGERVRNFFKRIMNFFKSFVAKPSLKNELFNAIDAGKFKDTKLSERAKTIAPAYSKKTVEGLSEQVTHEYVQDMVGYISYTLFKDGNKELLFNPEKLTGEEILSSLREDYQNRGVIDALGEERYNNLVKRTLQFLRTIGITVQAEEIVSINDEEANSRDYAPEPFSTDWKQHSTGALRFLLSTLQEREALNQTNLKENEALQLTETTESSIGGIRLLSFNRVFATLLDRLHNTNDATVFAEKFIQLVKEDANYAPLFVALGGDLVTKTFDYNKFGDSDWRLYIQFFNTFTRQKPEALIQYTNEEGDVHTSNANIFSIINQTVDSWVNNMKAIGKGEGGIIYYRKEEKVYRVKTDAIKALNIKKPKDMLKFLSALGIDFSLGTYEALSNKEAIINGELTTEEKIFTKSVSQIYANLGKNNNLMTFDAKRLDINGPLRALATLHIRLNNPNQESTYFGVEGQRIGSFAENNAPSYFENNFNESKTLDELLEKMPQLNDVYSRGAEVLRKGGLFFNEDGDRIAEIKVEYIQGSKNALSGKDKSTSKLGLGERFVQEINQNLNGKYYVLIPGDGSTEWMMTLGNVVSMDDIMAESHWEQVYSIYNNYLHDDIDLALEKRDKNFHTKNNSQDLRIMRDILPGKIVEEIERMIKEDSTIDEIEDYITKNKARIDDSIKDFIESTVDDTFKTLRETGQIFLQGEDEYSLSKFNSEFLKNYNLTSSVSYENVRNFLRFVNINYEINNHEYHKILFGDPHQFKTEKGKLDETKRIKSFLSPRRRTFNLTEYNNYLNNKYNSVDGIELTEEDPGYHNHKDYTNTITFNDVNIVGSIATTPNIPQEIKDAFANTNEADAMSLLMDATHKEIALKEGQWPREAEDFHQWHMAYTRRAFDKRGIQKYTSEKLRQLDDELLKEPIPKHKLAVRKPIISGNKANKNEIDLVLDKTSQMPLYYHMVEGTNLGEMYIKMFKQNVGYGIYISGRKVGAETLHDIYDSKGDLNSGDFESIIEIPWGIYGTQVETMSEGVKYQTRGSQLTKMGTIDLYENGEPIGDSPERKEIIREAVKRNNNAIDLLHINAYNELLNDLGIEDFGDEYVLENKQKISDTLMYEMLRRKLSENAKDTIELDENLEFLIPFEASPSYDQIKSILYSMVSKALTSPSMNGAPHVQVPVTMFEQAFKGRSLAMKTEDGWVKISKHQYSLLTEDEKKSVLLTDNTLKFYENEDGKRYAEIMVTASYIRKHLKHSSKFDTDAKLLTYLQSEEGKKILSGIGFRIPSQSLSSAEVFRIKSFLPEYMGYTVVVPSEITTKAGSDFDIDKLNMYLKSIYIDRTGNVRLVQYKGSEQATKDFFGKVYDDTTEVKILNKRQLIEAIDIIVYGLKDPKGLLNIYGNYIMSIQDQYDDPNVFRNEIERKLEKLTDKTLNAEMRENYTKKMYKAALENEYYESLEELLTLPENFNRLISPVNDGGLEKIAELLDEKRGYDETAIQGRLINRNYMTKMRHAFITGKKWVGIAAVNITNISLRQKSKVYLNPAKLPLLSANESKFVKNLNIVLPHNIVNVNGENYVSLSGRMTADGTQFISDRMSGYGTAFVDIANKPFITKIIKSDTVVGTFMFLESIGAGNNGIFFLNQPIIEKYLEYLDGIGSKNVIGKRNLEYIRDLFPTTDNLIESTNVSVKGLLGNIEAYAAGEKFTALQNAEQQLILDEFLKYKILADQLFSYTQAMNYDTTKFGSSDLYYKKQLGTLNAKSFNLISNVDDVLDKTFIGKQTELLGKAFDSFGVIMKTESPEIRAYMLSTLKRYATKKYMSADDYKRIANLIKNSFLDYIIQNNTSFKDMVEPMLVNAETAIVNDLEKAKQKYPSIQILQELVPVTGKREGSAKSIQLKANSKDVETENLYVGLMRELRDKNPELRELYNNIVNVAILQGMAQSSISIKNIIPVEDYAAKLAPIIEQLVPGIDLKGFESAMFERNNFANKEVFQEFTPYFMVSKMETVDPNTGEDVISHWFPNFKGVKGAPATSRQVMTLNENYNSFDLASDFLKVPKIVVNRDGKRVNMATGLAVTSRDYAIMKQKGSFSLYDAYYYQKVYTSNLDEFGNPIPLTKWNARTLSYDYYYKQINVFGDGNRAVEHNPALTPSVIDNGSMKVKRELTDLEIEQSVAPTAELMETKIPVIEEIKTEIPQDNSLSLQEENQKILESPEFIEFAKIEMEKSPDLTIKEVLAYYKKCK